MDKLKPCPFCGCPDRRVSVRKQGNKGYRVICDRCDAAGPYSGVMACTQGARENARKNAVETWNRRIDDVPIVGMYQPLKSTN